jgi:PIN domain nuclease of toxin-antitoxin system
LIVLDTHALVWWVADSPELSQTARVAIESQLSNPDGLVIVSSISVWEIALLVRKERLVLNIDLDTWLDTVGQIEGLRFMPVDNEVLIHSTRLPGEFHPDPADRIIVALARQLAAPLVTADAKIRAYRHVDTTW